MAGALFQYPKGKRTAYIGLGSHWEYWAPVNQETAPDGIGNSAPLPLRLTVRALL
jgi:hypothetical protein